MSSVLVSGVIVGFLYALMGSGLVLLYRQSGVLNFAHGAVGTLAAYVAYVCVDNGAPYWLAALAALGVGIVLSLLIELMVIRRLAHSSDFTIAIATLGVALTIIGFATMRWGSTPVALPHAIDSNFHVQVGPFAVGINQLFAIAVTLVLFAALYLTIERTRFGLAMRAASEGPVTAAMLGINVSAIRIASWALAGALSSVAGLLISPEYYLDPQFLTAFMITAFAAIVIGGLESIGGALAGGLVFGVGSALLSYYVTGRLSKTVSLAAILLVLALFPHGLFGRRLRRVVEPVIARQALPRGFSLLRRLRAIDLGFVGANRLRVLQLTSAVALVALLVLVPFFTSSNTVYELAGVAAIFPAVLGQNLISGYAGQPSIGQSGFMVVGAYVAALLVHHYNLAFPLALMAGMMVSSVVGVALALSAARLSGVYLALVTISFALALPELASFPTNATGGALGIELPPPVVLGLDLGDTTTLYLALVSVCILVGGIFYLASRRAPGRVWRAVRDSEAGAESIGLPVARVKLRVVALGGALAGLGGVLTGVLVGYLAPDSFTLWTSVYLLAAMIVGGSSSVLGSALGAAFIVLLPIYTSSLPQITQIVFGASILLAVTLAPDGLARLVRLRADGSMVQRQALGREPAPAGRSDLAAEG